MVAIDTNVIVRFLVRDDTTQYSKSRALIETENIFVSDTVVLETEWVLRDVYDLPPGEVCRVLRLFFGLRNVNLADAEKISRILDWHEAGLDFADAFHLANSRHLKSLKTFDKEFVKQAKKLLEPDACKVTFV